MSDETRPLRALATGVASGLVLMAVFSIWWASDTWIATWTTLLGLAGVVAVLADGSERPLAWSWVGAGAAVATLSYGGSMTGFGQRLLARSAGAPSAVAPSRPTVQG